MNEEIIERRFERQDDRIDRAMELSIRTSQSVDSLVNQVIPPIVEMTKQNAQKIASLHDATQDIKNDVKWHWKIIVAVVGVCGSLIGIIIKSDVVASFIYKITH